MWVAFVFGARIGPKRAAKHALSDELEFARHFQLLLRRGALWRALLE